MEGEEVAGDLNSFLTKLRGRTPPLVPKKIWDPEISRALESLSAPPLAKAVLYLWNDDLAKAHTLAQNIASPTGSLIHGMMHRREPDYGNSKYWFQRVGEHPIFSSLKKGFPDWGPFRFIDWCEGAAKGKGPKSREWLEKVQARELGLLAAYCLKPKSE